MNLSPNATPAKPNPDSRPHQLADAVRGLHETSPDAVRRRAKVIRTGDRDFISRTVRHLVYRRDKWTCQRCQRAPWGTHEDYQSGPLHLDHIIPWSAGGSDLTDNLRTLCGDCNMERSNYVGPNDKPALPIVLMCAPCLVGCEPQHQPWIEATAEQSRFPVWCAKHGYEGWAVRGWRVL
jgi:5-methylcytosine-specific restriction endonuclease McrA